MLRFNFENLKAYVVGKNGLTDSDILELSCIGSKAHNEFLKWRSTKDALFYDMVFDDSLLAGITEAGKSCSENFENIVVLGIGGSALGLSCITKALLPPFWNLKNTKERASLPLMFILDNIDPETFSGLCDLIEFKKSCFVVISKSGRTTETAAQFFLVLKKLKTELERNWREHIVVITDPEGGELRPFVKKEGILSFAIPPKLGGRFSVLSPVGLFPAACAGVDIEGLISGAAAMAKRSAKFDIEQNPAYQIGGYQYWFDAKKKKNISVMMPYSDALILAADWWAQLTAESLGKNGMGPTPVRALGATDQHSQVQLYMEGPSDKLFTFVGVESFRVPETHTKITEVVGSFDYLKGSDLGHILITEQRATTAALVKAGRPSLTITFPTVDAYHLGEFFMVYEIATAFAGALYGINPFDQPGVEMGKRLTREILESKA